MASRPELIRFTLLPDGTAHGGFSDQSLVVLNPCAVSFAVVSSDGSLVRGLTACTTAQLAHRVHRTVAARNTLGPHAPRLVWDALPLTAAPRHYFETIEPQLTVTWPQEPSAAASAARLDPPARLPPSRQARPPMRPI